MEYGKTVNLPKTDFPMKANLPVRELNFEKLWEDIDLYHKLLDRDNPKGRFLLHDGPPYSNGDIHMGHALNKLLKDFILRYKSMSGYATPYIPGWDNHGLPIEQKVSQMFAKKHVVPTKVEMRKACREYAAKQIDNQREQFKRLGVNGDWDNPYLTMTDIYEATIIKTFGRLVEQGYIYRGFKPIHWCINDETALAEAEIEYADHTSDSIFVRFALANDKNGLFEGIENPYTIIWTTTPWTIPANVAVAVHPENEYAFVKTADATYVIAKELTPKVMSKIGVENYDIIKTVPGKELEGTEFKHPLMDRLSVCVCADYVTLEDGTGVVHTAPGHGREDFETGVRYNLPIINPVNAAGRFTKEAGEFEGLHVFKQGNAAVMEALTKVGALLQTEQITHSYPHCWRCHKPVIFRTTVQWFMRIDHNELRQKMLEDIKKSIEFTPPEAANRLYAMIEGSPDWCLSRQRSWGVAIPVFYCKNCNHIVMEKETIDAVYEDSLKHGSDSWFEKSATELLPEGYKCPECGGTDFEKESDIFDVWFDSGSSCHCVLDNREELSYPADVYLEGSDQHRGWFNKSFVVGEATEGIPPFKQIISHGFMLAEDGRAMSKSAGNGISPLQIIKEVGADVLRLWVSSINYREDARIGKQIITRITDAYRRIRNTYRFALGNLYDFDPAADKVAYEDMLDIDKYALIRLNDTIEAITAAYEAYDFHKIYHAVHNYCSVDLSSLYFDVLKDRLYTSPAKSVERRSAQTVCFEILSALTRMLAPIMPHTSEEVYSFTPGKKEESVFLEKFPEVNPAWKNDALAEEWKALLEVRDAVLLAIEKARQDGVIAKPVESKAKVTASGDTYKLLKAHESELASLFIVSQAELLEGDGETTAEVTPAVGEKCDRCRLVSETVGDCGEHPTLCARCAEIVKNL